MYLLSGSPYALERFISFVLLVIASYVISKIAAKALYRNVNKTVKKE